MTVTNKAVGMRELDISTFFFRTKQLHISSPSSSQYFPLSVPHIARCLRLSSGTEVQLIRDTILPPLVCSAAKTNKVDMLKSIKVCLH